MSKKTAEDGNSDLEARVDALEARLEAQSRRLDELDGRLSDVEGSPTEARDGVDQYDAAVLEALEPGETVTVKHIRTLYRSKTRLSSSNTIQDRTKAILKTHAFKKVDTGTWKFQE